MFNFFKKLITPTHRHIETIPIYFNLELVTLPFGSFWWLSRYSQYTAITCYLHTCPECGEILEYGKNAKLTGQKFGNFYTTRTSLRLAKLIWETQLIKKLMDLKGEKSVVRFNKKSMNCWFGFFEKQKKVEQNQIDLAA
jgi:hypothetical protein